MSKLDQGLIDARIKKIRTAAGKLERFKNSTLAEFLGNSDNLDIAERNLEVAIEAMLDIGNHVIAALNLEKPEDYFDIFVILGKNRILPKSFAAKLAPLAGLRNRIIHNYLEIDYELILRNIRARLGDFEKFAKIILLFSERK